MTSDLDVFRAAQSLIERHCEDAPIHAAMRADELMEAGDIDGQAVWRRVLKAVDEWLSESRPEGEQIH